MSRALIFGKCPHDLQSVKDSKRPVQPSPLGLGVGMGSDQDTLARVWRLPEYIADAVHRGIEAGCAHPIKEPLTRFHILGRKGRTYDTGAILADGSEVPQVIHEPLGIDFRHDFMTPFFKYCLTHLGMQSVYMRTIH